MGIAPCPYSHGFAIFFLTCILFYVPQGSVLLLEFLFSPIW
uniref:Uncharacterized protein n=1 Tax=Anguilla anguilla TaxID=7936 RepID=A0A0E9TLN2_ANGAN